MIIIIIVIMLLVMAIFIFITYVITKKIVRPLKQITDAAGVIAEGKTDLDLKFCNTGDEVEILADSMKKTAEKLHGYMSYINALAYRDSLTGVKNLTAFKEATANIDVKISSGENPSIAVVVCDINCLKKTNDRYGHEIGNRLIIKATKVICDIFKHSPVFRIGGDEFVVILEGEDFENREALVSALDDACDNTFISAGEETIPVSIARGLELLNSEFDVSFVDAVNRADKKMYENKKSRSESKNI
jgi:diguanylate cyclase (GGDEF)-like protein